MRDSTPVGSKPIDRTNALIAALVFLGSFIVYAMTVQRSFSFWDCGEFIACAAILGIPHPPGTPLLIILGRVLSTIPFVEDVSYRINYVSVISSAFTAMFSYLLAVRLIRFFVTDEAEHPLNRLMVYVSGICAGFFVAFSATNWSNSVEAEAYGLALALSVVQFWLALRYLEVKGTPQAWRIVVLATYVAVLGIGVHMTAFLVFPVCAIFFVLNDRADRRDYFMICSFVLVELLLIVLFSNGRGGADLFKLISVVLGVVLLGMLFRKIRWDVLLAVGAISTIILTFQMFLWTMLIAPFAVVAIALAARHFGWSFQWKTALAILLAGFMGFSIHFFIPIRSTHQPRINENNPARGWPTDWRVFINFLDRKQYGEVSMVDRMFERRGQWSNQFGRHPNMGFWSYFEEQYGPGRWAFVPFLALGLLGALVAIRKRLEVGMPFLTLLLIASVGLILYMNFADGTRYNYATEDAYMEVRNRDYFFTPAFVFFGIAMGVGVAAVMKFLGDYGARRGEQVRRLAVYVSCVLVLLPVITLANNYHENDRSKNLLPYFYAKNLLDSCEQNAILFTGGDNDTFPVWCIQEAYNYRKDIKVVNLSLLNTDWYVAQMKHQYGVPISLTDDQILWYPYQMPNGMWTNRPEKQFVDRPRGRRTYMHPQFSGMRTQDLMVDEIVLENKFKYPVYFSAPPYAESPLKLRDRAVQVGQVFRLELNPERPLIDVEKGYDLYMNTYRFDGFENSEIFRDDNATGVFAGLAMQSLRVFDELLRRGDSARAKALLDTLIHRYPEFSQGCMSLADMYIAQGDTARALAVHQQLRDTLTAFLRTNLDNQFYVQDLGLANVDIGVLTGDKEMVDRGLEMVRRGFDLNRNSSLAFRKAVQVLWEQGRQDEMVQVAQEHVAYLINRDDALAQQILGLTPQRTSGPGE